MEDDSADLVSDLPQEILQHIVSLIPLKEAVRTSTLSTQWRSIWTPFLVNLEFDSNETITTKHLNKIMGTFLISYHTPQLLKLSLTIPDKLEKKDQFFLMATKGVHKDLHLDFSEQNKDTTTHFNLVLESINTAKTTFSSLKTLHLRSVTNIACNLVSALFSNCAILESLKLENCRGMENINVKANGCFERFIVLDCKELVSLSICAPNLKTFSFRGVLPIIQLENTTRLVDVTLELKEGNSKKEFDCEDVLSLLALIKDIEVLTISGWLIEWLCKAGVIFGKLEFKFNKLKELRWVDSLMNKHKRDSLACFLNITTFLEILFVNIDEKWSSFPCPLFHQYWHEPHLWMDYQMVKSNASQLNHLKIVNFAGFRKQRDELFLMDLLLHKAIALKEMIVTLSTDNSSWEVTKIPQSQLKKTSRCHLKRTVISSSTIDCSFVLTEQINNGFIL